MRLKNISNHYKKNNNFFLLLTPPLYIVNLCLGFFFGYKCNLERDYEKNLLIIKYTRILTKRYWEEKEKKQHKNWGYNSYHRIVYISENLFYFVVVSKNEKFFTSIMKTHRKKIYSQIRTVLSHTSISFRIFFDIHSSEQWTRIYFWIINIVQSLNLIVKLFNSDVIYLKWSFGWNNWHKIVAAHMLHLNRWEYL